MPDRRCDGENVVLERDRDCFQRRGFFRTRPFAFSGTLPLGLAQRECIVAEYRDRARHGADLVGAPAAVDRDAKIACGHLRHGLRHALQWPGDENLREQERAGKRGCRASGEHACRRPVSQHAAVRCLGFRAARLCSENIDQPVHLKRDVVARRIEFEIDDSPRLFGVAGLERRFETGGHFVRDFQLFGYPPHIVRSGRIIGQHIVQRVLRGSVFALDRLGRLPGLIGIRRRPDFIGCDTKRFDGCLCFGEREPRRREMLRYHRVDPVEFVELLQTEPVGGNRQQAEGCDQQNGFRRDRQMDRIQVEHDDGCAENSGGILAEQLFPSA